MSCLLYRCIHLIRIGVLINLLRKNTRFAKQCLHGLGFWKDGAYVYPVAVTRTRKEWSQEIGMRKVDGVPNTRNILTDLFYVFLKLRLASESFNEHICYA